MHATPLIIVPPLDGVGCAWDVEAHRSSVFYHIGGKILIRIYRKLFKDQCHGWVNKVNPKISSLNGISSVSFKLFWHIEGVINSWNFILHYITVLGFLCANHSGISGSEGEWCWRSQEAAWRGARIPGAHATQLPGPRGLTESTGQPGHPRDICMMQDKQN